MAAHEYWPRLKIWRYAAAERPSYCSKTFCVSNYGNSIRLPSKVSNIRLATAISKKPYRP